MSPVARLEDEFGQAWDRQAKSPANKLVNLLVNQYRVEYVVLPWQVYWTGVLPALPPEVAGDNDEAFVRRTRLADCLFLLKEE